MSLLRVAVAGLDRQGRRLADLLRTQADFSLSGTYDNWPDHLEAARRMGLPVAVSLEEMVGECDVLVHLGLDHVPQIERSIISRATLVAPRMPRNSVVFTVLQAPSLGGPVVQIPSANALAFGRLMRALHPFGPVNRFFASTFCRAGHATDAAAGSVDALEPLFDDDAEQADLQTLFQGIVPSYHVRRVRGPCTHADLHMIKIDFADAIDASAILAALRTVPRLIVAAARDGFTDTAQVQEFYRDMGAAHRDRHAVFIWEESVQVDASSLMLMANVCPDATPVPELFDAIRLCGRAELSLAEVVARTDAGLRLPRRWQDFGSLGREA